jgi:hypothetical protein
MQKETKNSSNVSKYFSNVFKKKIIYLKASKCKFGLATVEYIGRQISKDGITMSETKINSVLDFPKPFNNTTLRSFLGLANYFRDFVPNHSNVVNPLHKMIDPLRVVLRGRRPVYDQRYRRSNSNVYLFRLEVKWHINGWAAKNKNQTSTEPTFTFHERDITHDAPEDEFEPMTATAPLESAAAPLPPPPTFRPLPDAVPLPDTSPRLMDPSEIGGVREETIAPEYIEPSPDKNSSPQELPFDEPDPTPEAQILSLHTEKSTRIRKPTVRFNLGATTEPRATLGEAPRPQTALMSVARGLKLFKTETQKAIELEVA